MKYFLILFFLTTFFFARSQSFDASIQTTGLVAGGNSLPFWMTHNQLGRYSQTGNFQELTEGRFSGRTNVLGNLSLSYGTDLALLISKQGMDPKIIQAYLGLSGKVIRLQAGAFADEELMGGLSSSNGDLLRSLNYRPYPKVRLSTPGFIPFLFAKSWFRFSAEYDEGLLTDERVVDKPHLHHKSLMVQFLPHPTMRFTVGINHFVFWGGRSEEFGQLPQSLKDYPKYVMGVAGGDNFMETDQLNVAGSQLGSYLFSFEKDFDRYHIQLRASHPFEDGSGVGLKNKKDNLYTFYWRKHHSGTFLDEFLVEYLYSKHQSGDPYKMAEAGIPQIHISGGDNYFNNGIYASGFTYLGQSMGTPLFEPIRYRADGKVIGLTNTRVSAFHLGAKGTLIGNFSWKTLITYSRNFGTYSQPMSPYRSQLASLAELGWKSNTLPLQISGLLGYDTGKLLPHNLGIGIQVRWTLMQ